MSAVDEDFRTPDEGEMAGWTQGRSDGAIDGGEADEGDDDDREEDEDEEEAQSFFVRAVYDFTPADHSSLSFKQGDIIEVLTQLESGWWDGLIGGSVRGWFPSNYVEIVSEEEADEYFEQLLEKQEYEQQQQQQQQQLEQQRRQSDAHQQRIAQHGHTQQQEQQQQRRPSAALSGAQPYDGLGLGQDFDALRSLMGAQDDDADATFEQLAEAAMRASDPTLASLHSPSSSSSSSTAPVTATRSSRATSSAATTNMTAHESGRNRNSRISDLSWRNESYATTSTSASNASFVNTEKSYAATPRSTAPSLVDGDKLQTGAESRLAGPSERERERLRAHSLSLGPPSHLAAPGSLSASISLGRPRAATQASSRSRVAIRQTKDDQLNSFWVPKVNERGEIVYFNTRTGAQAQDLPEGADLAEDSLTPSPSPSDDEPEGWVLESSKTNASSSRPPFKRHSSTVYVNDGTRSRGASVSNSVASSGATSRRNHIDMMPPPDSVPYPWSIERTAEGDRFVYRNLETGETRFEHPIITADGRISHGVDALEQLAESGFAEDEEEDSQALKPSTVAAAATRTATTTGQGASSDDAPFTKADDEREALDLQSSLEPPVPATTLSLIASANRAIAVLASVAAESISTDGLSNEDRIAQASARQRRAKQGSHGRTYSDDPNDGQQGEDGEAGEEDALVEKSRLGAASTSVVAAIRNLLFAAGSLGVTHVDLMAVSELAGLAESQPSSASSSTLSSFRAALIALSNRSHHLDMSEQPIVAAAHQQAIQPPPASLEPLSKKLSATLSKLVLSVRTVIEESSVDKAHRAALTPAKLEKVNVYRSRIRDDTESLTKAIAAFGMEMERARGHYAYLGHHHKSSNSVNGGSGNAHTGGSGIAAGSSTTAPFTKRVQGVLRSGQGTAGVGLEILGGGSAAGWRGNGFVLPTPTEAAALQAEAMKSYENPFELTRDAQNALSSGKIALRRKPTAAFSRIDVEKVLMPRFSTLESQLEEFQATAQRNWRPQQQGSYHAAASGQRQAATVTTPSAAANGLPMNNNENEDGGGDDDDGEGGGRLVPNTLNGAMLLSSQVKLVLTRFGSLMVYIEEMDLATVLDVDGPDTQPHIGAEGEEYMASVARARDALHHFSAIKQGLYDVSARLMLEAQDIAIQLETEDGVSPPESRRDSDVSALVASFTVLLSIMRQVIEELVEVCEEQAQFTGAGERIGARSKIFGANNVQIGTGGRNLLRPQLSVRTSSVTRRAAGLNAADETSEQKPKDGDGEVMYLGPGLAVPSGPPSRSGAASATSQGVQSGYLSSQDAVSAQSSIPPQATNRIAASIRGGLASARARSGSVTTAASANSRDEGEDKLSRSQRMKKLFGDDSGSDHLSASQHSMQQPGQQQGQGQSQSQGQVQQGQSGSSGDTSQDGSVPPPPPKQIEEVPWFLETDYSPEDLVLNPNGQVKGATLGALIERLTLHNAYVDRSFSTTFLMTYRSFTTTDEFLDLVIARFRIKEPPGLTEEEQQIWVSKKQTLIRFRVSTVLKSWLESHFYNGEDERHLDRIEAFSHQELSQADGLKHASALLLRLVERRRGKNDQIRKMTLSVSAPSSIVPKNLRKMKFMDIDPLEMARQLTLKDSALYNAIRPAECLGKAWSKSDGAERAQAIRDVIKSNNRLSGWTSESILMQEDLKKRAAYVKQFVAIADRCYALNNFSSMMAIYSGLNNAALNRLRRTWDAVNQRHLALFENMKNILAPTKNFSKYRETLRKLQPPCVPFLGVYLTDLTFIEDGNSDRLKTDERLINFSKRQMTADKISEIVIFQSTPYNFHPVEGIQKYIDDNLVESRSDEELFEQSLRLEPREREDEKIARLLQESGFL